MYLKKTKNEYKISGNSRIKIYFPKQTRKSILSAQYGL